MSRIAWGLISLAWAMLVGGQAVAQPSPAEVVKKIYEQVAVFCSGEDVAPPYTDKFMREMFDKPVADRYLTRLHKSQVDFDIFIDGQDCKLTNLVIEPVEAPAGAPAVRARFSNFDTARTIDFEFHQAGAAWVIGDMRYRHRAFTLRSYLKLKPRG
jgi:hypothetical protein